MIDRRMELLYMVAFNDMIWELLHGLPCWKKGDSVDGWLNRRHYIGLIADTESWIKWVIEECE